MKRLLPSALALALMGASAAAGAAQSAAQPPAELASRKEAAMAMFAACHQREEVEAYFDKLAETQADQARAAYRQLSDAQWQQFTTAFRGNLRGYIDKYIDMMATIDATHFSESDMAAMADFCRTPVGERVSAARAQMERETFELRGAWLQGAVTTAGNDALRKVAPEGPGGGL